jgi:hypothetical protein
MSVEVIILLGIFVWAPLMAYLGWKYVQTFSSVREAALASAARGALYCSLPTATRFTRNADACAALSDGKLKQGGARVRCWLPLV